jgi:hypothetical protein
MTELKRHYFIRILFTIIFVWNGWAAAQLQIYNHPELKWQTIETDHFYIHFHEGAERTAAVTAKIAEEIYSPITSLYEYQPDGKVHFVIRDHDDDSNGAAFYYDNKIELGAPAMDFPLRGTHNWLRNVVTHEFSHLISLGAARKMPRQIPAIYFQWLDYEKERRTDVIHGYPKTLVSFPLAGTVIPPWFAEGMAQYHRSGLNYDVWDSHRDMLLRTAVLDDGLLTLSEMSYFGKNSLGNERVYNQGYALTLYIVHQYGEDRLRDLVKAMKAPLRTGFSGAVRKVLGKSEKELYKEWTAWLKVSYTEDLESLGQFTQEHILDGKGSGSFYPVLSPDRKKVAYLSNRGRDYLSQLSLWLLDMETGKTKKIKGGVTSSVSWSPDGESLVYAKKIKRTSQGSHYYDLYRLDLNRKKEIRLTKNLRTREPDWSPDDHKLVCVVEKDGTSNLAVMGVDGKDFHSITVFQNGEQVFTPRWMKDGRRIVFAISGPRHARDIASILPDGTDFRYEIQSEHDERDPFPGIDGQTILYSCDQNGIFNLYKKNLITGETAQISNVPGGAFMPAGNSEDMVYVCFTVHGFKLARLKSTSALDTLNPGYAGPYKALQENQRERSIAQYDDSRVPAYLSKPYKNQFSKLTFLPRVVRDYPGKIKVGTYFYGMDFLDKINVLGGFAVNGSLDMDIFGIFEYKKLYPTLFLEAYYQAQHMSYGEDEYLYNLIEVDIGGDWRLGDKHVLRTAYVFSRYSAKVTFEDYLSQIVNLSFKYHLGNALQVKWHYRSVPGAIQSSIAPTQGRIITASVEHCWYRFLDDFKEEFFPVIVGDYFNYSYDQLSLDWQEYLPGLLKHHSLALRFRGGFIDQPVHSFYNFFGGGLDGLKGYPYYSMEGRRLIQLDLAYRFPISQNLDLRLWFLHFNQLYLSLYGQAGETWDRGGFETTRWKKDVGVQMRLGLTSFYTYPMSLFVDAVYGLDGFTHKDQTYGQEWRVYFGLLFDFLD